MLSLILCNRNPLKWLTVTAMYEKFLAGSDHEIIGIHDATGICEGYNRGLDRAKGDLIAFSHDDVEFLHDSFATNLTTHLQTHDVIGLAGASKVVGGGWGDARHPYLLGQIAQFRGDTFPVTFFGVHPTPWPAKILDGVFLACRRSVLEKVRFDPANFPAWHGYDADFSYSAHLAGFKVAVTSDLFAIHYSWGTEDDTWKQARAAFMAKHRLPSVPLREGYISGTLVNSKAEVLELMQEALTISKGSVA
jgi:GT2 family glycosyltransferase